MIHLVEVKSLGCLLRVSLAFSWFSF